MSDSPVRSSRLQLALMGGMSITVLITTVVSYLPGGVRIPRLGVCVC